MTDTNTVFKIILKFEGFYSKFAKGKNTLGLAQITQFIRLHKKLLIGIGFHCNTNCPLAS